MRTKYSKVSFVKIPKLLDGELPPLVEAKRKKDARVENVVIRHKKI